MAGERKGKTYEAIVHAALSMLRAKRAFQGEVFWNKKPNGMSIEPDLTLGPDQNNPHTIFLITQSGAAGNSHMKSWRNLGELVESKTVLVSTPSTLSIIFDSVAKVELKKLQAAAFDGQLIVGDRPYGDDLQRWVDDHLGELPVNGYAKSAEILERYENGSDKELCKLLDLLVADLKVLLKSENAPMNTLWALERSRAKGRAPSAKTTYVRRGATKLLLAHSVSDMKRLYDGEVMPASSFPEYIYRLGLAERFGQCGKEIARPRDEELSMLFRLFSSDTSALKSILDAAPVEKMEGWLHALRNVEHAAFSIDYVVEEFDRLIDPDQLLKDLKALSLDPWALIDPSAAPEDWPPHSVWLFETLIELIKATTNAANGYGYAQLARETAELPGLPSPESTVYRIELPDWLLRRGNLQVPEDVLQGLATVLSARLAELGVDKLKGLQESLPALTATNILEAKLMTYRGFEPLATLILSVVKSAKRVAIRSCFAEAAGLQGQAGKTSLLQAKGTLINWQSAHDSHTNDKKKELCGRAIALRYHWNPVKKVFELRPNVKKLILVLDGTWKQSDVDALVRAGWDEIYYADEMDKLAKAIV